MNDNLTAEEYEFPSDAIIDIGYANFGRVVRSDNKRTDVNGQIGILDFDAVIA